MLSFGFVAIAVGILLLSWSPPAAAASISGGPIAPSCDRAPCTSPLASNVPDAGGLAWVHLHRSNATLPAARNHPALAEDPADHGVLLFGGCGPAACPMGDTWWYSAGGWNNLTPNLTISPSPRYGAVMTYDPSSGAVLLFGGCTSYGPVGDSWLFVNGSWSALHPSGSAPSARCFASASSDSSANGVVIFGGTAASGSDLSDLWLFSNGGWTTLGQTGGSGPSARHGASLGFDIGTESLLLFGGISASGTAFGDSWLFGTQGWAPLNGAGQLSEGPSARAWGSLSYDPLLSGDLFFGGSNGNALYGDTWLFAGGSWTNISSVVSHPPAPRSESATAFDSTDGYLVLEGGRTSLSGVRNDTWAFVLPLTAAVVNPYPSPAPQELLKFSATVSGGLPPYHDNWSFGDGTPSLRYATPTHTYSAPGAYNISLSVTDTRGVTIWSNTTLEVGVQALRISLSVTPTQVGRGGSVSLSAFPVGGVPPYALQWSGLPLGCVANSSPSLRCIPESSGSFAIQVAVTDSLGSSATAGATISIVPATTSAALVPTGGTLSTFNHLGWILIPPLAAAVATGAYASYATYRAARNPAAPGAPAPRPECYVPPDWSETPAQLGEEVPGKSSPGSDSLR
jgi:hypothetical protein